MSTAPFISVILPTRNRPKLLADCLACLRANDYPQREIVVVDQSRDGETAAVVQRAAVLDASLRYVRSDAVGSSHTQNVALQLARGEVVAMTNDDCRPAANWLARLAEEFASNPQVVAVFGPFLPLSSSSQALPVAVLTGRRRWSPRNSQEIWRLGYGGNMAFRLRAVLDAGGLDEMLGPASPRGWGCNDVDLVYRVLRRGGLAVYDPGIVVWHVQQYDLRQALRREAAYARGAGAIVAKSLRCGDRAACRLLAQRLWPVGPGRDWLEIIVVEGDCPPRQRNEAARRANGDVLYFLDDDSVVAPDTLRRLAAHYRNPNTHAVGGPALTPDSEPLLSRCIGYALGTHLGAWTMRARYAQVGRCRPATEKELIGCNLSVRRDVFWAVGGFREDLFPNEETELVSRLQRHGNLLLYDPHLPIWRAQRRSLTTLARQFFAYGRGRIRQIMRTFPSANLVFLAPALGWVYVTLLPALWWKLGAWVALPVVMYLALVLSTSIYLGLKHRRVAGSVLLLVLFSIIIIHISYGCGLICQSLAVRPGGQKASPL